MTTPRYDTIGRGYADYRRPDPRIAELVLAALGDARTVVNVGAGTGSYEPDDRPVIPIEPSPVMARQRDRALAPAVLGVAEDLPLADASVDAALAVLTMHHWTDLSRGLAELIRVTRQRIVTVTVDPDVQASAYWLHRDYLPDLAAHDRRVFPALERLASELGGTTDVIPVPVPADCSDGMLLAFWSRPESLFDPAARGATSGFAQMDPDIQADMLDQLAEDLSDGSWDRVNGHLRDTAELDVGLRLTVTQLT